ncbi:acetyl xylan esterase [Pantoea sp. M_8]|nr:acetyl xylan esterase [Pantoea sp. M_6]KAA5974143.1 acetyl xylan esterase [Pantoea sp. M_8]KAA5987335.1 acetyl xylan esterase [Pantoea sp. M_10]MVT82317.1 acetyl xylan esterase [Pantoea agglomerans]
MQLHVPRKTPPLLALQGVSVLQKLMRIHARYACMAHLRVTEPE